MDASGLRNLDRAALPQVSARERDAAAKSCCVPPAADNNLTHYTSGDHTKHTRSTAVIVASSEYTWGASLGLAELTVSWARSAWGEGAATEWLYLVRSSAIAMDALPQPPSDTAR